MSSKRTVALSGLSALAVAVMLITVSFFTGIGPSVRIAGAGTLSVTITDPPHVPPGVSAVYVAYSNLGAHVSGAGNSSGWTTIKSSGTIELLGTINVSQTLSTSKVQSGVYNLLRFNISSAKVTFNGVNYTAFVPRAILTIPIVGGVQVSNSKLSGTIIDIQPTVLNIGSDTTPEFIIRPAARAYAIPQGEVSQQMEREGFRLSLVGKAWWKQAENGLTGNLQITSATLTTGSISISVTNPATKNTTLLLATITPLLDDLGHRGMPVRMDRSAVFAILSNHSLVPVGKYVGSMMSSDDQTRKAIASSLLAHGLTLNAGETADLNYAGSVTLGLHQMGRSTVVPGQQYMVTVIGSEAVAGFVVRAS